MKIQFDIKYRPQIESGEYKVETKDGKQARIVSWDKNGFECKEIVALVTNATGTESCNIYTIDGLLRSNSCQKKMNLFIVTPEQEEPDLTGFESGLFSAFSDAWQQQYLLGEEVNVVEWTKEHSAELLSLAREQFIKDGYVIEKKAFHDAVEKIDDKYKAEMSIEYSLHCKIENRTRHAIMNWDTFQKVAQKFIDIGRAEALKDLPKWKYNISYNDNPFIYGWHKENGSVEYWLEYKGKTIMLEDLEKLPKEDEK